MNSMKYANETYFTEVSNKLLLKLNIHKLILQDCIKLYTISNTGEHAMHTKLCTCTHNNQ